MFAPPRRWCVCWIFSIIDNNSNLAEIHNSTLESSECSRSGSFFWCKKKKAQTTHHAVSERSEQINFIRNTSITTEIVSTAAAAACATEFEMLCVWTRNII